MKTVANDKKCLIEIDKLIEATFVVNLAHSIKDERFMKLTAGYGAEQWELMTVIESSKNELYMKPSKRKRIYAYF